MDSSSPRSESEVEVESDDKDRISWLPEQVIGSILARLRSREAQATCVLSRRWRHLCTSLLTDLDFDRLDLLEEMEDNPELAEKERARYVDWVDNVVNRQSGGEHTLRRFALRFDLNISYSSHIDRWIKFAFEKKVKVLKLDFVPACDDDIEPDCDPSRLPYLFGHEVLIDADAGRSRQASCLGNFGLCPSVSWHVGCRYLEHLYLNRVSVEGELIEQLLATCPVLEKLVLKFARSLNRFRVSGQSLKLKYLHIIYCDDLQRVEIHDTNLGSFTYCGTGEHIPFCLDEVPQLSEVSIRRCRSKQVDAIMYHLSSVSCLQILKLQLVHSYFQRPWTRELPKLASVKQLELRCEGFQDSSLLPLTPVIEACPCLESFVLELMEPRDMLCWRTGLRRVVSPPHQYLKVVEFYNYYGGPCDLELVNYLIKNAIALEKLVVKPCGEEYFSDGMKKVKEPRERALQQLKRKLPSRIELVIN